MTLSQAEEEPEKENILTATCSMPHIREPACLLFCPVMYTGEAHRL